MTDATDDELIIRRFREWLETTRLDASEDRDDDEGIEAPLFGLERLVEEFTALRHEIKLQTRGSRALEEGVAASLARLDEVASSFRSGIARIGRPGTGDRERKIAMILAETEEAIERGREQWSRRFGQLEGPEESPGLAALKLSHANRPWWRRRLAEARHREDCLAVERAESPARSGRREVLAALLSGYDMIHQRLERAMAAIGLVRIATVGQAFDPECMVALEAVETDGPEGEVIEEARAGYAFDGTALRPAEVKVIRSRSCIAADD